MKRILFALLLAPILIQLLVTAQAPPQSKAGISSMVGRLQGVVVRSGSNDPLPNTRVQIKDSQTAEAPISTMTGSDGRFDFRNVVPASYRLIASRSGYADSDGLVVTLATGEDSDQRIELTPGGVISGSVSDRGAPAARAIVVAQRVSFDCDGHSVLTDRISATTNDLGQYRLFWLSPGRYYVAATVTDSGTVRDSFLKLLPRNAAGGRGTNADSNAPAHEEHITTRPVLNLPAGGGMRYVASYAPNTADWRNSTIIEIGPGSEVPQINIDASPLPVLHIRGHVIGVPQNLRALRVPLTLTLADRGSDITARTESDGVFDIPVVIPGAYVLSAKLPGVLVEGQVSAGSLAGQVTIDVRNGDVNGVALALQPSFRLSVKVQIDNRITSNASGLAALGLLLRPEPWTPGAVEYQFDRAFEADDPPDNLRGSTPGDLAIPAGDYSVLVDPIQTCRPVPAVPRLRPTVAALAYVKSIRMGATDALKDGLHLKEQPKEPLDIAIGTKGAVVDGRVIDGKRQPLANATVTLIPEDNLRFRVQHKVTSTNQAGAFEFQGVAPGDYKIFAWETVEKFGWQNAEFMGPYEKSGKRVQVRESEVKPVGEVEVISTSHAP